jgi:hypothetical protein
MLIYSSKSPDFPLTQILNCQNLPQSRAVVRGPLPLVEAGQKLELLRHIQ